MNHIGIFIAYFPEQSIRKEGLGRLLAFILRGALTRSDLRITIGCPRWYVPEIHDLFHDHGIDAQRIEFLTTASVPYAFRLRAWLKRRRQRRRRNFVQKLIMRVRYFGRHEAMKLAASYDLPSALTSAVKLLGLLIAVLLSLVIASPLLIPVGIAFACWALLPGRIRRAVRSRLSGSLLFFRHEKWAQEALELLRQQEMRRLVSRINERPDIAAWYSPTLFWPETKNINAHVTVGAPDIVMFDFPARFAGPYTEKIFDRLADTAIAADQLITYSEHVRDDHLVNALGVNARNVTVIRHGKTDLSRYLQNGRLNMSIEGMRGVAEEMLRKYSLSSMRGAPYWRQTDFARTPYIFYSSQVRPHKNVLSLIKMVSALNRKRHQNIRLVLTGRVQLDPFTHDYIRENGLEPYVYSAHDLTSEQLAAFNACATLSITPTLFEGGFPFTFCEAYSVGTPSLMSDIPVTRELLKSHPPELADRMLFDPYDVDDLERKTMWALENRSQLFNMQDALFQSFPSWEDVAGKYISTIMQKSAV